MSFTYGINGDHATLTGSTGPINNGVIALTYSGLPVTEIIDNAFNNTNIITGTISLSNFTTIGIGAFNACSGLTGTLDLSNVTSIGIQTFKGCFGFDTLVLSIALITIPANAFEGCFGITGPLNLSNVTTIGAGAFYDCYGFNGNLTLSSSLTTIPNDAFTLCSNLSGHLNLSNVTTIGDRAFNGCNTFDTLTLSSSLTNIGSQSFNGCSGLINTLTLSSSLTNIGSQAFYDCSGLTSFTPLTSNTLTTIGDRAFGQCEINSYDFTYCSILTSIDTTAFNHSTQTSITVFVNPTTYNLITPSSFPFFVTFIEQGVFTYQVSGNYAILTGATGPITDGVVATTYQGFPVTQVAANAFANNINITGTINLSDVNTIGDQAFQSCTSLMSVTFHPNSVLSTIGINAFLACTSLTSVTIPNSVTSIGVNAFQACTSLTSVTFSIPSSVTSIGNSAFDGCSFTSVTIPNSVTSISDGVFRNCTNLTSVTIPNSVTAIGDEAFLDCTNLTSVTMSNSVTSIGDYAFYNCAVNIFDLTGCTPTLYENTFLSTIPVTVYINDQMTLPTTSAANVTYIVIQFIYALNPDSTYTLTKYIGSDTNVVIPNEYQSEPVTSIGDSTFKGKSLVSVTIPNSVTSIGDEAFQNCTNLTGYLSLPPSITTIGKSAFLGCGFSGTLSLPPLLEVLEEGVFDRCSFTSLAPPTNLRSIGAYAFYDNPMFVYDFTHCEQLAYIDPTAFNMSGRYEFLDVNVYVTAFTYERIRNIPFPRYVKLHTGVPVSNICFVADTLVETDQGDLPIQTLTRKNTLRGQPIQVTKTKHDDPYLVKIQAYAFTDIPTQDTYMSMNHRVYFNHDRVKARDLVNGETVTLVAYSGEPLYNVLVKAHTSMLVYGLRVETLDPTSVIALLYTSKLSPNQRVKIIQKLNTQENYEETVTYLKRNQ